MVYFVEKTSKHLTCHFHLLNALLPFCDCVSLIKWFIYEKFYWKNVQVFETTFLYAKIEMKIKQQKSEYQEGLSTTYNINININTDFWETFPCVHV